MTTTTPWVEVRVHGVSGTPPEEMLDIDRVRQVAGDELGRVFQRADREGGALPEPDHRTLAYHWGRLTSGSTAQGLWLLLAPFGLVNAAQFMLEPPETPAERGAHTVAGAMLRVLGLMLTLMFVLTAAVITIDLWAWQREAATNGVAVVLGMVGPVVLVMVYLLLARRSPGSSLVVPTDRSDMPFVPEGQRRSDLVRPGFFEGDPGARALRRLHVAAGLALVAVLGFAPGAARGNPIDHDGFWTALWVLTVVVVFVLVLGDPERSASTTWKEPGPKLKAFHKASGPAAGALVGLSTVALLVAAVRVGTQPLPTGARNQHYGGMDWASFVVMTIAAAALASLAVANGALAFLRRNTDARHRRRAFRPYARGMTATLIAAAGTFLGVGYAGAFTTFLATTLSTPGRPVAVPELLARIVYAWGITVCAAAVVGGFAVGGLLCARRRLEGYADEDFTLPRESGAPGGTPGKRRIPDRWLVKIAIAIWVARVKNRIARVLTVFVLLGLILTGFALYELEPLFSAVGSWPRLNPYPREAAGLLSLLSASPTWPSDLIGNLAVLRAALIAVGTTALTGLATALVFLGRKALRGEAGRRGINVVWDVISFWPRSAHPFVPAAYSQRAVPDLECLIRTQLATNDEDRLVLCGHSQGSLLSFAALLRLQSIDENPPPPDGNEPPPPRLLPRIGLLTFGSQLQVMFSRAFPAYVNQDAIQHLYTGLDTRWRNLYRDTDHLAGPVLSWSHDRATGTAERIGATGPQSSRWTDERQEYGPDWRLVDPPMPVCADLERAVLLPLRRHSDYWLDPAWRDAMDEVRVPAAGGSAEPSAAPAPSPERNGEPVRAPARPSRPASTPPSPAPYPPHAAGPGLRRVP